MIENVYWLSCKVPVIFCQILIQLDFSRQIFEKSSDSKLHENPSIWNRVAPCGQTDVTKLIVTFRNFANAPKKGSSYKIISIQHEI